VNHRESLQSLAFFLAYAHICPSPIDHACQLLENAISYQRLGNENKCTSELQVCHLSIYKAQLLLPQL